MIQNAPRRLAPWLVTLLFAFATAHAAAPGDAAYAAVDPFIGTGGEGHTYPGATVPFGMVQLSPDTQIKPRKEAYPWAAGYRHDDQTIVGFSHTHFSGSGHSDLGDVLLMPISGEPKLERGDISQPGSGYTSRFRHQSEQAQPGYYAVTLDDYGIRAELTASARVGVHRYSFPKGKPAHVLVDLRTSMYDYPGKVLWSRLRVRPDGTVTGFRETRGWAPGRQLYFAMRFSQPLTGTALHDSEQNVPYKGFPPPGADDPRQRAQIEGRQLVGVFDFGQGGGAPLVVKVAISPVSEDNAIANLDAEVPGFDFDAVRADARKQWTQALSAIDAQGSAEQRTRFYTALYHTLLGPTL
ncbi:MAG TPA: glycoside hydrolase domain-containing protein, partial [Stenotrophomonas sp.]|nr:glycoside hydrolase domain-containing protein [Stenotrophomonas sp.]